VRDDIGVHQRRTQALKASGNRALAAADAARQADPEDSRFSHEAADFPRRRAPIPNT
jgi:hypothetical protein